jgi:O-phosphoseryl-tRNA(Sec) kinase
MSNIVLIPCIGIPAAGKTTSIQQLSECQLHVNEPHQSIVHICFDDIYEFIQQKYQHLYQCKLVSKFIQIQCLHITRMFIFQYIEHIINTSQHNQQPQSDEQRFILLLDDNFYYRSMRYIYYQLARKCKQNIRYNLETTTKMKNKNK